MRIRVTLTKDEGKLLREKVLEGAETIEEDKEGEEDWETVRLFHPRTFYAR